MTRPPVVRSIAVWAITLAATTGALLAFRDQLDKAHVALVLLLVVLGAGAQGGRLLGLGIAALSFLIFDLLFLPPFGTLIVRNPLDWLVLVAFTVVSVVAAQLLHRERRQAERAVERAGEVDRLAVLGADALNAARAEEALQAIVAVVRSSTAASECAVYLADGRTPPRLGASTDPSDAARDVPPLVEWVAEHRAPAAELEDGTTRLAQPGEELRHLIAASGPRVRSVLAPLAVRAEAVGVLRLTGGALGTLDAPRFRFFDALAYYAALGADRVRLEAEAGRAEALREADKLKDALIASVSHDLRTPLTAIKALAHGLGELGDERAQVIEEQADRLNRYVADLLDISQIRAGAMPTHVAINVVDDLLSAVVQETEGAAAGRLQVHVPPGDALLAGRFDLAHAVRIVVNLVENALKYSPASEAVTLITGRAGESLVIAVEDRGDGVAPEERTRIFEPFYRPTGAREGAKGAGLGLAIARRLAEGQGGRLDHEAREGGGSRFVLSLPAIELDGDAGPSGDFVKS
jgi:two-component system sensor histidine kinase KdpD